MQILCIKTLHSSAFLSVYCYCTILLLEGAEQVRHGLRHFVGGEIAVLHILLLHEHSAQTAGTVAARSAGRGSRCRAEQQLGALEVLVDVQEQLRVSTNRYIGSSSVS